ncbi:Anaerobic dimethyl sulfoxide reductase chain B [Zhongshania aliphaticivorans]|uniref:Anaerobic dimethyl sulfoxide reductase chain B n=1 Tax=Zhongshania aliphaticivorans TaxID=1470434 RepID=A0A5S9N4G1_9GAMM|nr:DmsC/YnfH family molybdoenzyme membrane anchor subunit [Zhongshania aliphaticivorans]CAA0082797.1 Anaerobic dimethyl sulfoxide reductase chain B [Zhongshania aliphaticivorans]CAA0083928.1 Anaerobic dimethyl sulfoxide reductase chain B [Zhongshania aliphaticivorans]
MWKVRDDEPSYAFLKESTAPEVNYYEAPIDLIARTGGAHSSDREMFINEEPGVGANPNRNKQHAFHFTADNCIGCHACEAACSEKNDNPAHISFRSVGYVEGGTYPDFKRMNISMACNHCDDPVCLKGCPTRAYTKHVEYGAVLQDPETCFGCGYCTWVCPYNAPQLDPIKGQVSKCNMCVDRLEVNLKPACVSACLGNALNFGVVDDLPENREQGKTSIPGFPDPEITHPNIRFQQIKNMPDEVTRTDGMAVKYHKSEDGQYRPVVDQKKGVEKKWSFTKLSSRENPLVIFTLVSQTSLGAFLIAFLGAQLGVESLLAVRDSVMYLPLMLVTVGLAGLGMLMSATHLGKPWRFYRGFNNLRHSPVCREGLGMLLYMVFAGLHLLAMLPANEVFITFAGEWGRFDGVATVSGYLALMAGSVGLYYMYRCYRIPARPFWNHWQTATSFLGTAFSLGSVLIALVGIPTLMLLGAEASSAELFSIVLGGVVLGGVLEGVGLLGHGMAMNTANNEGGVSHYIQCTLFGKSYTLRNILIAVNIGAATALLIAGPSMLSLGASLLICLSVLVTALIGRALFYVLVIPTTMPGAFFWKNKDFEEHAREIGLANMPQVGVVAHAH